MKKLALESIYYKVESRRALTRSVFMPETS